ncbi:FAD-dependent monooxygenase [Amycolatopsis sp. NBC_00355]|uniref:FAD-dependent monooxygenase n=1 Tax=Amycolatopsis sp. NBC_00355 TaxID=2975957 RepID=UPI002E2616E6
MEDVVIAGAGPNGLMLACELALAGVRPVVLEQLPEPSPTPRANGLVGQVVRLLDRRGLHERLAGPIGPPVPAFVFGAMRLDLTLAEHNSLNILPVPQRRIEGALGERAAELGVEVRRGHAVTGLVQDDEQVTVEIAGPDGPYALTARYVVGADGGKSVTRKLAGIGFPGVTDDRTTSYSASATVPAELIDPASGGLRVPGHGVIPPLFHYRTEHGLFVYAPLPTGTGVTAIEWGDDGEDDDRPVTLDEVRASIHRVLGHDLPIGPPEGDGPHLLRRLKGRNTRLADRFRAGRVLLVGDAAHVHSAIGGPGLNLGLQDAVNLGWKLAAALGDRAPAGLLDTYEAERRPVAERVVMHSQAQSALIAPGSDVTALRELFGELLRQPSTVQHIADLMSGADIRYEPATDHPLDGRWAPDLVLADGRRLAELTRTARPLLLDLTPAASLGDELSGWTDRVDVVTGEADQDATAMLIRPDGYVAWASGSTDPGDTERKALREAAERWFGSPVDM